MNSSNLIKLLEKSQKKYIIYIMKRGEKNRFFRIREKNRIYI